MIEHSFIYFNTLRYLRPVQIYGRLWHRFYSPSVPEKPSPPMRVAANPWVPGIAQSLSMLAANQFVFLNKEGELSGADSWNDPARDKLWLYNLHYFDDLNADGAVERVDWHQALIQRLFDNRDELDGLARASLAAAPGHSGVVQARKMLDVLENTSSVD